MPKQTKILLVDDDPAGAELTLAALSLVRSDLAVDVVGDGEEALDYLFRRGAYQENHDDGIPALLLDLKMPKVDGYEVLRQLRADARLKQVPVVVLTSSNQEADRRLSRDSGADDFIVKPANLQALIDELRRVEHVLFGDIDSTVT